jgi:phenylalanyl-tRNA synthetase beta chain
MADFLWKNVMDVIRNNNMKFRPISAFPQVRRDLALVLDKQVTYGELERIALKSEPKLLQSINAFDVYVGDKIEQGKKSYAISVLLQDDEKTMTDQDIDRVVNKLVKQFEKELGASLRG